MRSSLSLTTPQASRAAHVPRGPPHPNLIGPSRQGHAVLPGNRNMRRRAEGPQSPAGELGLWWRSPRIGRGAVTPSGEGASACCHPDSRCALGLSRARRSGTRGELENERRAYFLLGRHHLALYHRHKEALCGLPMPPCPCVSTHSVTHLSSPLQR